MSKLGILGGGIGGSCLARALKQHGFTSNHKYSVRLIEQEPFRVNTFGGGITLTPNALRGLDSLGLYSKVRKYSVPLKNIFTYNDKGKLLRKHNYEFVENHYGYPILLMDRTYLNMVLVEDIPQQWWKLGSTVSAVEQDAKGVVAIFDDGNYEDFDALVGCDGVDSVVAEYIRRETNQRPKPENEKPNNEDEPEEDELEDDYELELGSTTVLGVSEPLKNPSIAPGDIHWVFGENLVYGAYALKDNRVVWFTTQIDEEPEPFWSPETAENIKSIQESNWWFPDSQSFSKTEFFEKTEKAIKVGTMKLATELKIWSKDRITLLGDAAHHSFPYIGYGPNTAIEDAIVLSNLIMKNPKTLDVAFKEYESKRVQRCNKLSELAADSVDLHTNEEAKETWWRDTLMRLLPDFMYNRELQWIYGYQPIIANLAKDEPELAVIPASLPASSRKDAIGKWVEIPDAPTPELQPEEVPTQAANPKEMKPSISATITANSNTKKQATQYTKHRRVKVY